MKKLILHIGRHKTGTSSLQHFFVENRDLLETKGFYYPRTGIQGYGHHEIAKPLSRRAMKFKSLSEVLLQSQWISFVKELNSVNDTSQIIVSSEAFQNCKPSLIAEVFSHYHVEVHVYLREHASYLLSSYAQSVQATSNQMTLAEYEEKTFYADYENFTKQWCEAFGESAVKVHLFDRAHLVNGDIIQDFLAKALGFDENFRRQFQYREMDQNPSLGGTLVEFKRLLNMNGVTDRQGERGIYQALKKMAMVDKYQDRLTMSESTYNHLKTKYSEGNSRVSARFFGDSQVLEIKVPDVFSSKNRMVLTETDLDEMLKDFSELLPDQEVPLLDCNLGTEKERFIYSKWRWFQMLLKSILR